MEDISVKLTRDEAQYLLNAVDTHVKTHGLGVATAAVIILSKLQAASNSPSEPEVEDSKSTPDPEAS